MNKPKLQRASELVLDHGNFFSFDLVMFLTKETKIIIGNQVIQQFNLSSIKCLIRNETQSSLDISVSTINSSDCSISKLASDFIASCVVTGQCSVCSCFPNAAALFIIKHAAIHSKCEIWLDLRALILLFLEQSWTSLTLLFQK